MAGEQAEISVREAGRQGGRKVADKYGRAYFSEIGKKGGEAVKAKHGPDYYARIGRIGGSLKGRKRAAPG